LNLQTIQQLCIIGKTKVNIRAKFHMVIAKGVCGEMIAAFVHTDS
jgi:hypothetical protein